MTESSEASSTGEHADNRFAASYHAWNPTRSKAISPFAKTQPGTFPSRGGSGIDRGGTQMVSTAMSRSSQLPRARSVIMSYASLTSSQITHRSIPSILFPVPHQGARSRQRRHIRVAVPGLRYPMAPSRTDRETEAGNSML